MIIPPFLSFILYNPLRLALTDRQDVLAVSHIGPSTLVLEIGAGNGFFTEVLAQQAAYVLAVELQRGMVQKLKRRLIKVKGKVHVIQGDIAQVELLPDFFDVAFLYFSFHEIVKKEEAAKVILRAVKRGGYISIFEPTIEVSAAKMERTASLFEKMGALRVAERSTLFSRFLLLQK